MSARFRRLVCESLEVRTLLAITAQEQAMIYYINYARHDPVAFAAEMDLGVDLSGAAPRPPLAVNEDLNESAELRATEMATHDYFDHRSQVTGKWPNQIAREAGYALPGNFANAANYIESIAAGTFWSEALEPLKALLVDEGVPSLGHRVHLLGIDDFAAANREIGVGYAYAAAARYDNYWAIHATRTNTADTFLTGVVYDDLDGDLKYDAGEGLAGVTIQVGGFTISSNAAGGWSFQVAPGTNWTVTASGGSFVGTSSTIVSVGSNNIEIDFLSRRASPSVNFGPPGAETPGNAADWHKSSQPNDLNSDDLVDIADALAGLIYLRSNRSKNLSNATDRIGSPAPFMDADRDGMASINDVLSVINQLRRSAQTGEGELATSADSDIHDAALTWLLAESTTPLGKRRSA